jgi:hypothetical protein
MGNIERLIENYENSPQNLNPAQERIARMHIKIKEMETNCQHCQTLKSRIDSDSHSAVLSFVGRDDEASPTSERKRIVSAAAD